MEAKFILVCGLLFFADCAYVTKINRDCNKPVGVEDRTKITDQQISASSHWNHHYASNARLNNQASLSSSGEVIWGAWCTHKLNKKQFLQIDLGHERLVSGVATQGYMWGMFVSKYKVYYSTDGKGWQAYKEPGANVTKEFLGNWDNDTVIRKFFTQPVKAKYIRFNPVEWNSNGYICMRVEIYECIDVES